MRTLLELEPREFRVLGALLEKEQTTPEYYPMTLKGLVAACNQKTNREPVMSMGELEVLNVLRVLLQENLVERSTGARADRWGHRVDESIHFKRDWKAILTLLLLRGAQTPGELRARADRMHSFDSLEEVDRTLRELAAETPPWVVELARRPGQKETRWSLNVEGLVEAESQDWEAPAAVSSQTPSSLEQRLARLEAVVERLSASLAEVRRDLGLEDASRALAEPGDVDGER